MILRSLRVDKGKVTVSGLKKVYNFLKEMEIFWRWMDILVVMMSNVYKLPKEIVRMQIWRKIENMVEVSTYWRQKIKTMM